VLGYGLATAGQETTDDAFVEADIVSVQAEVGGRVLEVLAHTDQRVAAGDDPERTPPRRARRRRLDRHGGHR
jgi:membrane fusion protein (multidrug efflux system)